VLHENIQDFYDPTIAVDMLDTINTKCEDPSLVIDRFYNNMTIGELAKARGVCGETIRIRLKKNLEKLRLSLTKSV
jgi:DNA-directed RNA polymerase specialized sigma24 family protein